jgi:SAM-dependent methyltransferase
LKDVEPEKLSGVDHSEEAVRACRETNKWSKFTLVEPDPPTLLTPESFGLIYLYSVFSHLPEDMHWTLLKEFHRLLAPGGMFIATTRPRDFIHDCKTLRDDPRLNEKPDHLKGSARTFVDVDATLSAYDNGQFCYESVGAEGRWSFWGEACIPKSYVERRWREIFDVCEYIDDREACPPKRHCRSQTGLSLLRSKTLTVIPVTGLDAGLDAEATSGCALFCAHPT